MIEIKQISPSTLAFTVDTQIFNDRVITKTLYWLSADWTIYQQAIENRIQIQLEKKTGTIEAGEFQTLKHQVNQHLIDFKTRDIINQETQSIRNLLLVKAFSATDEFDEKNIFPDEELN